MAIETMEMGIILMEIILNTNYMDVGINFGKYGGQVGAFNAPLDEHPSNLMPCPGVLCVIFLVYVFSVEESSCSSVSTGH